MNTVLYHYKIEIKYTNIYSNITPYVKFINNEHSSKQSPY